MRKTGLVWECPHCHKEFEVFSDDGANDMTVCWNWCPHCGNKVNIWIRFKQTNEPLKLGLTYDQSQQLQRKKVDTNTT